MHEWKAGSARVKKSGHARGHTRAGKRHASGWVGDSFRISRTRARRNDGGKERREARAPVVSVNGAATTGSGGRISLFNSRIV